MNISEERLKQIINECVDNLMSLGSEWELSDDLTIDLNFFEATSVLGQCGIGLTENNTFKQIVRFNKHIMFDSLEDIIINNVYHELCHYYQNREAVKTGFYYIDEAGNPQQRDDKALFDYFVGDDAGHSECWLKYVRIVNEKLKPAIPVSAHPGPIEIDKYFEVNDENILFTIYCTKCDNKMKFLSYSSLDWDTLPLGFLAELVKCQKEGKENNYCKCGGCLKIDAKDEKTLYNILEKERDRFFAEMFGTIGGLLHGKH